MAEDTTGDDNVVAGPGNGNGNGGNKGGGGQTSDQIIASIKGEFKAQKAKEFKQAAAGVLKEIDEAKKVLKLAEAKLAKLVDEFRAESA